MPKRYEELLSRDAKRDIGRELLRAIRQVKAGKVAEYKVSTKRSSQLSVEPKKKLSTSKPRKGVR